MTKSSKCGIIDNRRIKMSKDTKQGVPDGLPIIGEEDKAKEMSIAILNALKPTIDNFLMAVEEVQSRLAIVEGLINGALVDVLVRRVKDELIASPPIYITPTQAVDELVDEVNKKEKK